MKRVLVTGVTGFVGPHLTRRLADAGFDVVGLGRRSDPPPGLALYKRVPSLPTTVGGWHALLHDLAPNIVVHLAAQSNVPRSWASPSMTVRDNILVSTGLLEAVRDTDSVTAILVVGSSEEYGPQGADPISEEAMLHPQNPYATSKAAVGWLTHQILSRASVRWYHVRPFNHFGPGQGPGFVVPDFCREIVAVERGQRPFMRVGNTAAIRDFLSVSDVVQAYAELLQSSAPSGCYNVASGRGIAISDVLTSLLNMASCPIRVEIDPSRNRPADVPVFIGNADKIHRATGWTAQVRMEEALRSTLDWWRKTGESK